MFKKFNVVSLPDKLPESQNSSAMDNVFTEKKAKDLVRNQIIIKDNELEINGEELGKNWFPAEKCDVFLSHSSKDQPIVQKFKYYLEGFKLKVFIDSEMWGFYHHLKMALYDEVHDDIFSGSGGRMYVKDFLTHEKMKLVDTWAIILLNMALMNQIDNCEAFFFLNTQNSTNNSLTTSSPWLYQEIGIANLIRTQSEKKQANFSVSYESSQDSPNIVMPLPIAIQDWTTLDKSLFKLWEKEASQSEHSLKALYSILGT